MYLLIASLFRIPRLSPDFSLHILTGLLDCSLCTLGHPLGFQVFANATFQRYRLAPTRAIQWTFVPCRDCKESCTKGVTLTKMQTVGRWKTARIPTVHYRNEIARRGAVATLLYKNEGEATGD